MSDATNDNRTSGIAPLPSPDAHGQAALLLVESLIHGLVARSGLSAGEAVSIVESAIEVQHDVSDDQGNDPAVETVSGHLLSQIAASLRIDQT